MTDLLGVLPDSHPADVADLTAVLLAWRHEVHTDSDRELLDAAVETKPSLGESHERNGVGEAAQPIDRGAR